MSKGDFGQIADDFRERRDNAHETMRKLRDTLERKQIAEITGEEYQPTSEDRNYAEVGLSLLGQSIGAVGDTAFRMIPFEDEIGDFFGAVSEGVINAPLAAPARTGYGPTGDTGAPTLGDAITTFVEENPRAAENLGNLANVGTAALAAKTTFRPEDRGRSLTGVSNWIADFYNRDKSEGRKRLLTNIGIDINDRNLTKSFKEGLDEVFTQIVRGETPDAALETFFKKNSIDQVFDQTGLTPAALSKQVVKTSNKMRANWLFRKFAQGYVI